MDAETLAAALEREHRDIDAGIGEFTAGLEAGEARTDELSRATVALRRHIYLEEEFLFPPMRSGGLMAPLFVMVRQHGEIWAALDKLESAVAHNTSAAAVGTACRELTALVDAHNEKEEPVIYPQADRVLSDWEQGILRQHLAGGKLPDGWVCQAAR